MASIPMKITVGLTDSEYRPCYVIKLSRHGGQSKCKALFHKWALEQEPISPGLTVGSHPGGQSSHTRALVEYEDGTTHLVAPELVRFADTEGLMNQIAWPGEENDNATRTKETTATCD